MKVARIVVLGAAAALSGCHALSARLNPDCHSKQEYTEARQVALLRVPDGLDSPNTESSLSIPTVELAPPLPGPKDACLDTPPKYTPAPSNKAGSPG
jgi:uncharacterized lipoprotein